MNELNESSIYEITNENLPLIQKKKFSYRKFKTSINKMLNLQNNEINNKENDQNISLPNVIVSNNNTLKSFDSNVSSSDDLNLSDFDYVNKSNNKIILEEEKQINDIERSEAIEILRKQEWCCFFFVLMSLIVSIEYQEIKSNPPLISKTNNKLYNISNNFLLIICSICVLCFSKILFFIFFSFNFY